MSYSIETILAEKLETILSRNVTSTRPRDYYDVYILSSGTKRIKVKELKIALELTCEQRKTTAVLFQIPEIISAIKNSKYLSDQWETFIKKMPYAPDISFIQVLETIEKLLNSINNT